MDKQHYFLAVRQSVEPLLSLEYLVSNMHVLFFMLNFLILASVFRI